MPTDALKVSEIQRERYHEHSAEIQQRIEYGKYSPFEKIRIYSEKYVGNEKHYTSRAEHYGGSTKIVQREEVIYRRTEKHRHGHHIAFYKGFADPEVGFGEFEHQPE